MAKKQAENPDSAMQCDCEVIHDEIVDRVRGMMPPDNDFHNLADLYKMFSDPTRVKILWALHCNEMCVCDLAVLLNMKKSAISHHLKPLRLTNLVKFQKIGREVRYSLSDEHVKDIFEKGFAHVHE